VLRRIKKALATWGANHEQFAYYERLKSKNFGDELDSQASFEYPERKGDRRDPFRRLIEGFAESMARRATRPTHSSTSFWLSAADRARMDTLVFG
jgi:hypothetical protein